MSGRERAAAPALRSGYDIGQLKGRSLAVKMVGRTFPIIALVVLATQMAVGFLTYQAQLSTLEARAELVAQLTAEAIARPLWNLDRPVYESQIRAAARDRGFIHAALIDERGTVLFAHEGPKLPGRVITVSVPVIEPNSSPPAKLARLDVSLSTAELAAGVQQQLLVGLVAFTVLLLAFSGIVHLALRSMVLRPLNLLLHAMGRVERKDWQFADWSTGDELGRVVEAFNRMVDRLRSGDEAQRLLQELKIAQQQLTENNDQLERANKLVLESINYARRIQTALLPDPSVLQGLAADTAVLWEPRDIVGGDFYWYGAIRGKLVIVLVDCTGHGVPGAFMTMIVASVLDRVLQDHGQDDPAEILGELDQLVRALLRQDRDEGGSDDGFDAAICVYDPAEQLLTYAGAQIPLVVASAHALSTIKADRHSLAYRNGGRHSFTNHVLAVEPGMSIYLASDGVTDQLSPAGRLFGRKRLLEQLADGCGESLEIQVERVKAALDDWRSGEPCLDDMTLVACQLTSADVTPGDAPPGDASRRRVPAVALGVQSPA